VKKKDAGSSGRRRKRVAPGDKPALALSRDERNLILHNVISGGLTDKQLMALERAARPELRMTVAEWHEFGGWVAGTANHARSGSRLRSRADKFFNRIHAMLDGRTDS